MLAHPQRERFCAAHRQPCVVRSGNAAGGVLLKSDLLVQRLVVGDGDAADDVAVTADILGRRMDHDLRAQRQRLLKIWRCERIVDRDDLARSRGAARSRAMSTSLSSGLLGVSTQKSFVFGRIASRTASGSVMST